jgi:hypothetical protein
MGFGVKNTRREAHVRVLVYADGGVGKSTFGAAAPKPIFLAPEDGLVNIDANAIDPSPSTWAEAIASLDHVATLGYETIVVDSLDWLEPMCWAEVCRKGTKKDIEAFGYGKGYVAALDEWRVFLSKLSQLRERGMNVVLIAHAVAKLFKNPEGEDFDRWQIKLHDKAAGLVKEWCDVVAFAQYETNTYETNSGKVKGISTGKRVLRVQRTAAFDAKTRYAMPASIPLDWSSFAQAVRDGGPVAVERMKKELDAKLLELGDEDCERGARTFLRTRGETVGSLSEALATVETYLVERRKAG